MDKRSVGLTLLGVGVAGTHFTLWLLALAARVLKKLFPLEPGGKP